MKFVIVLEDDEYMQRQIVEAIEGIDPKIAIRGFPNLVSYADWFKSVLEKGPIALMTAGVHLGGADPAPMTDKEPHQLRAIISKIEFMGEKELNLVEKVNAALVKKGLCSADNPAAIVLTAFTSSDFNPASFHKKYINNLIYKPFDKLILQQHLIYAIEGRRPPGKYVIHNQKTVAEVEMLKSVEVEILGEHGFVTRSDQNIKLGAVSKFYGQPFNADIYRSVIAVCRKCIPHPKVPGSFQVFCSYFSIDNNQTSNIRKLLNNKTAIKASLDLAGDSANKKLFLNGIVFTHGQADLIQLKQSLEKEFTNLKVVTYDHEGRLFNEIDRKKAEEELNFSTVFATPANLITTVFLDKTRTNIVRVEPAAAESDLLCGVAFKEWTGVISKKALLVDADHQSTFRELLSHGKLKVGDHGMLVFTAEDHSKFYVDISQSKVVKSAEGEEEFALVFKPLSKVEVLREKWKKIPLKESTDFIILDAGDFQSKDDKYWTEFYERLATFEQTMGWIHYGRPKVILISKKHLPEAEEKALATKVDDLFLFPLDRTYFYKKIFVSLPQLQPNDQFQPPAAIVFQDHVKVATPVKISEISETALVMEYNRDLPIGDYREFVLWRPDEVNSPEIAASNNFWEKDGKTIKNNFVFFGVTDEIAKYIRVWIRDVYIQSKGDKG